MKFFGFKQVTAEEKNHLIHQVFQDVSSHYDCMNDILSLGTHRLWKDWFAEECAVTDKMRVLDVAGGTGDISLRLLKPFQQSKYCPEVILCDSNRYMLQQIQHKAWDKGIFQGLKIICGTAESLPIPDDSIDLYTISFGIRNVTHPDKALKEARRVLKPGGIFRCMEFNNMKGHFFEPLYKKYLSFWLPFVGKVVANNKDAYQYLGESIRQFPNEEHFKKSIINAGFTQATSHHYTGNIVTIYNAT